MHWFLNSFIGILFSIGLSRTRWMWLPALILGLFLFWIFLAWNRVPTFHDRIELSTRSLFAVDNSEISIQIKHPYFSLNSFSSDFYDFWTKKGQTNAGVYLLIEPKVSNTLCVNPNDSLFKKYKNYFKVNNINGALDSISTFYELIVHKELYGQIDDREIKPRLYKGKMVNGFSLIKRIPSYNNNICEDYVYALAGISANASNIFALGYNTKILLGLRRLFRMEDISQFNYILQLTGISNRVKNITIDFGGPMEFKGIAPVPDAIESTRIIYKSPDKIEEIRERKCIKLFCQSIESINIQNIRLFLLTTISTLCIGYTLKEFGVFILFLGRKLYKKWERDSRKKLKRGK